MLLTKTGLALTILFTPAIHPSDEDFKLVREKNGISLYERQIVHNGNDVRELKADFTVNVSDFNKVIRLLKDPVKGAEWNNNTSSYKIGLTERDNVWLVYVRYDIPWPMNDQDCCLMFYYSQPAPGSKTLDVCFQSTTHSKFPENKNVTRLTGIKGKWAMEVAENGELKISYRITTDRSNKIPRWISDPLVHDNLFKTISSFKNILETGNR